MSHQEGTTKNAVLHKTAKIELSVFAPDLLLLCIFFLMYKFPLTKKHVLPYA